MWEIAKLLWAEPCSEASELELEAMLAIAAILTTGRNLGRLHRLKVYRKPKLVGAEKPREGIVLTDREFNWDLIAGSPSRRKEIKAAAKKEAEEGNKNKCRKTRAARARPIRARYDDRNITFPVAPIVLARLKYCNIEIGKSPTRLFKHELEPLIGAIEILLGTRRGSDFAAPRRCSRTLESITRFMMVEIIHQAGADIAIASRLTDSTHPLAESPSYYGVSRLRDPSSRMRRATARLHPNGSFLDPHLGEEQWLGSTLAPSKGDVDALIGQLRADFRPGDEVKNQHRAMVMQTLALVSFAIGHRGRGFHLPSTAAIDQHTGFCRVNEKHPDDSSKFRMVWLCDVAREQIALYEQHIEALQLEISPAEFRLIRGYLSQGRLPLFDMTLKGVRHHSIRVMWERFRRRAPQLKRAYPNSGRHWLRSNLEGKCSTETLHAMFGHWHIGGEPWSYGSCFDPLIYRADLQRTIPLLFKDLKWEAVSSPLVQSNG